MTQTRKSVPGGGGAVIVASKIILNNWSITASGDGLYVITPDGIVTKIELIDFRQTPVPETATLALEPTQQSVPSITVGTGSPGAIPSGNWEGGGGAGGFPATASQSGADGLGVVGNPNLNNSTVPLTPENAANLGSNGNPGSGPGYQPLSATGLATLTKHNLASQQFLDGIDSLCKTLNVPCDNMVVIFAIECSFNPKAQNTRGAHPTYATGLNQITKTTAEGIGYTVDQILKMTPEEQINGPTKAYFLHWKHLMPNNPTCADLYMVNLFPAAVGKPDNYICGSPQYDGTPTPGGPREIVASGNPAFKGPDGFVTVKSFRDWVNNNYQKKLNS